MPISIDIGTRNLHMVRGHATGQRVAIEQAVIETLPTGLVQDGIIRDFNGLETAFKNMLDKYRIKDKSCIISINGSHIYTRELDVPKAAPKVLANVVAFEVQNVMNATKEVCVEYVATKQQITDKPNMLHVRASAIQSDYVLDYGKLLGNLKLKPIAMDIHPNAITKLINNRDINDTQTKNRNIMLIDIGCVSSTAYVINDGDIIYTRIIPVGTIDLERYVINYNNREKPENHISLDKINLSLDHLRINQDLGDVVRPLVLSLTDGVNRIMQYLSGRFQGNALDKIFVYGRGSTFQGVEQTLSEAIRIPVERINRLSNVSITSSEGIAPFLNAIGALIRL